MAIHRHLGVARKHGIQRRLVINRALEGRAHGIYHQARTCGIQGCLQRVGNHATHVVALDQAHIEILQVTQAIIAIVCLVRHIYHRHLARGLLKIIHAKIDAMIIAICATHRHQTPHIIKGKTILRSKILNHFALKLARTQRPDISKGVAGIVDQEILHLIIRVPLIEVGQRRHLITGIAESPGSVSVTLFGPFVKFIKSRFYSLLSI